MSRVIDSTNYPTFIEFVVRFESDQPGVSFDDTRLQAPDLNSVNLAIANYILARIQASSIQNNTVQFNDDGTPVDANLSASLKSQAPSLSISK